MTKSAILCCTIARLRQKSGKDLDKADEINIFHSFFHLKFLDVMCSSCEATLVSLVFSDLLCLILMSLLYSWDCVVASNSIRQYLAFAPLQWRKSLSRTAHNFFNLYPGGWSRPFFWSMPNSIICDWCEP